MVGGQLGSQPNDCGIAEDGASLREGKPGVPIFPELLHWLREDWEYAPAGAVYVVDEKIRKSATGPNGWRNCNLRQQFERIVERAGLKRWPRLFHNLRSSRQTELAETSRRMSTARGSATPKPSRPRTICKSLIRTSNARRI